MGTLTATKVKALAKPGRYGDGDGLWLQVRAADRKSWLFRYMLHRRAREMGLGPVDLVSLSEARDAARDCRRQLLSGIDPIEARRSKAAAGAAEAGRSFKDVAEAYITAHAPGWKNEKHQDQWRSTLSAYAFPKFGARPVSAVEVGDVMDALQPIWRTVPETASRLRGRVEAILDFAAARGWRSGANPARWRGHLDSLLPARSKVSRVVHHAALPWRDMADFMKDLRDEGGVGAMALRFVILCAARTGEVIGARWSEVDEANAIWIVPENRMKSGRAHRVPLSPAALAAIAAAKPLRQSRAADAFIFPGGKPKSGLSTMALTATLRRMDRTDITVHGFRSAFRDWAGESTAYPREVVEFALAHVLKNKTEAAYARGDLLDRRRPLMDDWAAFCGMDGGRV